MVNFWIVLCCYAVVAIGVILNKLIGVIIVGLIQNLIFF